MTTRHKNRDSRIDFIRGFSMLVIVLYHYSCVFELENTVGPWRPFWHFASGAWGAVFVVVFFIISGYVMNMLYLRELEVLSFWKKRWLKIFPMFYIAWIVMFIIRSIQYRTIFWGGNPILILESIFGMDGYLKHHKENYYSVGEWFLGAIIIVYLLFPAVRWFYKKVKLEITAAFLGLLIMLEMTGGITYITKSNMFFCIMAFWIGMLFFDSKEWLKNKFSGAASFCVLAFFCAIDFTSVMSEQMIIHIVGVAAFIFLYSLPTERLNSIPLLSKIIFLLSALSYPVMITHHVLVYWGVHAFEKIGMNLNIGLFILIPVIYLVSYGLNCLTKIVEKIFVNLAIFAKERA